VLDGERRPSGQKCELSRGKRWLFSAVIFLMVWGVCELIFVLVSPSTLPPVNAVNPRVFVERYRSTITRLIEGRTTVVELSPHLGWTHKPWGKAGSSRINGQRMRADHDYSLLPPPDTLRIATFGDSFVFGTGVEIEQTWQFLVEQSVPDVEVLNFGVSGYGTDQALLRYVDEGVRFSPNVVTLGYIVHNSRRNKNTFRPLLRTATGLPMGKPRFVVEGDRLVLIENPLPKPADYQRLLDDPEAMLEKIGEHDDLYKQFKSSPVPLLGRSPTFRAVRYWFARLRALVQRSFRRDPGTDWYRLGGGNDPLLFRILDEFVVVAEKNRARPVVMLFPTLFDYRDLARTGETGYQRVRAFLEGQNHPHVDVAEFFQEHLDQGGKVEDLFVNGARGAHYSPLGQAIIADAMVKMLGLHGCQTQPALAQSEPE